MPNSRLIPAQFKNRSVPSPALSVAGDLDRSSDSRPPPSAPPRVQGEFIMSGSLTPPFDGAGAAPEMPGLPAGPMPGFHRRKEVQFMLRRWQNRFSLWARIVSSPSRGPWDHSGQFAQLNHTLYIR